MIQSTMTTGGAHVLQKLTGIQQDQQRINTRMIHQGLVDENQAINQNRDGILSWASKETSPTFTDRYNESIRRRKPGTGEWILKKDDFQDWLDGKTRMMWCPGMPGAGKTIAI